MSMVDWLVNFGDGINTFIEETVPIKWKPFAIIAVYTIIISVYAIFIWKFYRFLAHRDLLKLNLRQYGRSRHPIAQKFFGYLLYLLEYLIILPLMVFVWFGILSLFLLVLSENQNVAQILLISGSVVAAVRLTSYFSEDLSKDLAKVFPFTILAVFLSNPQFFSIQKLMERVAEIPSLLDHIMIYLLFILIIEALMRFLFLFSFVFSRQREEAEEKAEIERKVGRIPEPEEPDI